MTQAEVKKLASEIIGDGQTPNKWFVTTSPYIKTPEGDEELLEYAVESDAYTYGPFESYEEAVDCYEEQELDPEYGVGQVVIEDRECGTVREKWLTKNFVVTYGEDERDDSYLYSK